MDAQNDYKLHSVCKNDDIEEVRNLLLKGISVNLRDDEQNTPLHIAAKYNSKNCLLYLIEKGADMYSKNKCNLSPLHVAAKHHSVDCVRILIEKGANVDEVGFANWTPMFEAVLEDSVECLKILLNNGANIYAKGTECGEIAFHRSIESGSIRCFECFMAIGMNVHIEDDEGNTPLHYAAMADQLILFKILVQKGGDIHRKNRSGETPLFQAVFNGSCDVLEYLVKDCGVHINSKYEKGETLLHVCASNANNPKKCMEILLDAGIEGLNDKTHDDGCTVLHYAAERASEEYEWIECLQLLIQKGADYTVCDNNGKTFLDYMDDESSKEEMEEYLYALSKNKNSSLQ